MSIESDFKKALDYYGAGGSANIELAMSIFRKLAINERIPEAWYMLGRCYDKCGDPVEATEWMLMAAEEGVKQAQFDVAIGYEIGKGVPQNYEEAAKWYRKAAAQGVKEAQDNLNELINKGKIKVAPAPATPSASPGARLVSGNTASMEERLKQAQALLDSKQYTEAATMVEALANEGYAPAMAQMGALYGRGQGVAKDYNKMDEWDRKATEAFRISAEQGDAEGQCGYAACFQYTVSPDLAKAAFWYEKAAAQGHKRAKEELAKLKAQGKI